MDCCFSFGTKFKPTPPSPPPTSSPPRVLTLDGMLMEYSGPVTVSQVLGRADQRTSFLCSESSIFPDAVIPAMDSEDLLEPDHIYFQLPIETIRLSGPEMAKLAVRASSVLPVRSDMVVGGQPCEKKRLSTIQEIDES